MFPPITAVGDYDNRTDEMFRDYVNSIISLGRMPTVLRIRSCDSRARAFLTPFVEQLGIPLEEEEDLPSLSQAMMDYADQSEEDHEQINELTQMICKFIEEGDVSQLRHLPPEIQMLCKAMLYDDEHGIPLSVKEKIRSCLPYWS